ncbi:prepilin-type N-terminal cleavage/methylation domain-containing protein [bacterium]|nr:MAG: prepilin-type N-terminal cleavage/methylation domain-containing protein [bacterium]
MKKAFTLIELLVVIAIIAILAAILFPVFAQAKQAAKKTVSLSNAKQLTLACILYSVDSEDTQVLSISLSEEGAPAVAGEGFGIQPWTWLVMPYMKAADLVADPQAPPIASIGPGWSDAASKALCPQYGYNATYLSFMTYVDWVKELHPVSATAIGSPSETVLLAAKFSNGETILPPDSFFWYGPGSTPTTVMVGPPDCTTESDPMVWCYGGWGKGGLYDDIYLQGNTQAGSRTGGMSLRSAGLAVVSWVDGHASAKSTGYMAQGTNWSAEANSGEVVITDESKYLWDIE